MRATSVLRTFGGELARRLTRSPRDRSHVGAKAELATTSFEDRRVATPAERRADTFDELLAQGGRGDGSQDADRAWLDSPLAGREPL